MDKEELKLSKWFHTIDPNELKGIEEFALWLNALIHNGCMVVEINGHQEIMESKALVARLNGLKIMIYSNEHPPPHFHIKSSDVDASFTIRDCRLLEGSVSSRVEKLIRFWHREAKDTLIEAWNSSRPTNCVVGKYEENN